MLTETIPPSKRPNRTWPIRSTARRRPRNVTRAANISTEDDDWDALLARAKELSDVLVPPSKRPKRRNHTAEIVVPPARPEDTEMDSLLARAEELSSVLSGRIPPSKRPNYTWPIRSLATKKSNATASQPLPRNRSRSRKANFSRPADTDLEALLARAKELSDVLVPPSKRPKRRNRAELRLVGLRPFTTHAAKGSAPITDGAVKGASVRRIHRVRRHCAAVHRRDLTAQPQ